MMNAVRRFWQRIAPHAIRKRLSDWRHNGEREDAVQVQIAELKSEIDELRADQRRVAQLMDTIERIALSVQVEPEKPTQE